MGIIAHPNAPHAIVEQITQLEVPYMTFDGSEVTGIIEIHQDLAEETEAFFREAVNVGFPIEGIVPASDYDFDDDALMAANMTSGFNYRNVLGQKKLSLHALGRAFDVNPLLNPYTAYGEDGAEQLQLPVGAAYDPNMAGTLSSSHPLVEYMRQRNWEWGGDWTVASGRIDRHHFQKLTSLDGIGIL